MAVLQFVTEQAGCSSCAARIQDALMSIALVEEIELDEEADAASVRLRTQERLSQDAVGRVLEKASLGSGHEYRIREGSWLALRGDVASSA